MRVAYLLGSLNKGGTETLMLDLFRQAKACGLEAVAIYRKTGVCESDFVASGVPMKQLNPRKGLIAYLPALRRELRSNRVEVVHAVQAIDLLYARLATLGTGIKVVATYHGFDFTESRRARLLATMALSLADRNVFVSYFQRRYYQQRFRLDEKKTAVLYNGISFAKLDKAPKGTLRQELQLKDRTLLLGMVGNFNAVRDQYTVCRFLKLLNRQMLDFAFVFVGKRVTGQEDLFDRCVAYCDAHSLTDRVHFLGMRQDVPSILQELDVFVYGSDHDTFGIAVVEAMAVGVPVFVNDWGAMKELTQEGALANLYKSESEEELMDKFELFLQDKASILQKAALARETVRQKYAIETHIEKLKKLYEELRG